MNTLTALLLWMLSHFAPAEVVCVQLDIPADQCDAQRVHAELQPGQDAQRDQHDAEADGDEGPPRVNADLERGRATRISNGF